MAARDPTQPLQREQPRGRPGGLFGFARAQIYARRSLPVEGSGRTARSPSSGQGDQEAARFYGVARFGCGPDEFEVVQTLPDLSPRPHGSV